MIEVHSADDEGELSVEQTFELTFIRFHLTNLLVTISKHLKSFRFSEPLF